MPAVRNAVLKVDSVAPLRGIAFMVLGTIYAGIASVTLQRTDFGIGQGDDR